MALLRVLLNSMRHTLPLAIKGIIAKVLILLCWRIKKSVVKEINTRGISKEFACVLCGVDRLGNIYTGLICDGRPNYTDINRALSEVVEENLFYVLINIGVISHLRLNIILNYIKLGAGEKSGYL